MINNHVEYILCAAIWYKKDRTVLPDLNHLIYRPRNVLYGYVIPGHRHNVIIEMNAAITGEPTRKETSVQGFLTSNNNFVDREEAGLIALKARQIKHHERGDELISEELY